MAVMVAGAVPSKPVSLHEKVSVAPPVPATIFWTLKSRPGEVRAGFDRPCRLDTWICPPSNFPLQVMLPGATETLLVEQRQPGLKVTVPVASMVTVSPEVSVRVITGAVNAHAGAAAANIRSEIAERVVDKYFASLKPGSQNVVHELSSARTEL